MKKYKVVVVGCGNMANAWVDYALEREDVEIVALVDINEENAKRMAEQKGLSCNVFMDLSEAIKSTEANLIFDVTIPEGHFNVVTTALRLGCNVFGEKPMAAKMEDAIEMLDNVKKTGKTYTVMQNKRFGKDIRAYKQFIQSGIIGEAGYICGDLFLGPHFNGFREIMESPLILDMAIHIFDQARFIIDKKPISVYCHEFSPTGSWYKGDAATVCIFEFEDGSAFCFRGSWCAEGCATSWDGDWRVMGSKGTAIWTGGKAPFAEVVIPSDEKKFTNATQRIEADYSWNGREKHKGCLDEMFGALNENRPAETDSKDNIISMAMVFGAIKSSREGRKVLLTEVL